MTPLGRRALHHSCRVNSSDKNPSEFPPISEGALDGLGFCLSKLSCRPRLHRPRMFTSKPRCIPKREGEERFQVISRRSNDKHGNPYSASAHAQRARAARAPTPLDRDCLSTRRRKVSRLGRAGRLVIHTLCMYVGYLLRSLSGVHSTPLQFFLFEKHCSADAAGAAAADAAQIRHTRSCTTKMRLRRRWGIRGAATDGPTDDGVSIWKGRTGGRKEGRREGRRRGGA